MRPDHAALARSGFRDRVEQARLLAAVAELDDDALAVRVVDRSHPEHNAAKQVLLDRYLPMLSRVARQICGHLSHLGQRCTAGSCPHAYCSAMGELASRLTGDRLQYAHTGHGASSFYSNANERARRTDTPSSSISRWLRSRERKPHLSLAAGISGDLRGAGRHADVRRRWNQDRSLPVRVNLSADQQVRLAAALQQFVTNELTDCFAQLIIDYGPGIAVKGWAECLYDDACDIAPPGITGPFVKRIARAVQWPAEDERVDEYRRAVGHLVSLFAEFDDGAFVDHYLDPAYHLTRSHQATPDELARSLAAFDDLHGHKRSTEAPR